MHVKGSLLGIQHKGFSYTALFLPCCVSGHLHELQIAYFCVPPAAKFTCSYVEYIRHTDSDVHRLVDAQGQLTRNIYIGCPLCST